MTTDSQMLTIRPLDRAEIDAPSVPQRIDSTTPSYRSDIDGLRALAVLPVVLYHAGVPGFQGGYVGVDVFFVISGFLITSILYSEISSGRFDLARFYERRIRRLLPALVAVLAFTTLLSYWLLLPTQLKDYGQSLIAASVFSSNVLFWREAGYFDAPAELKPLLHTWSLAVEEQFYLFFPPLLYLLATRVATRLHVVIATLFVASLIANLALTPAHQQATFFLLPFRAWELLAGAALALSMVPAPRHRAIAEASSALGLVLILVPVFLYSSATPFPGWAAVPPVIGAALIIYAGQQAPTRVGRFLGLPLLVGIGLISYSLYLWHWPAILFTKYVAGGVLTPWQQVATIAGSLVVAVLSWRFIEKPFRHPVAPMPRRALFSITGAIFAVCIAIGVWFHAAQGLPTRLPNEARTLVAALDDFRPEPDRCGRWPGAGPLVHELCLIGAQDRPPSFLMWGDSHAGILVHGVDPVAAAAGRAGLFSNLAGCPPLVGIAKDESVADAATDAKCSRLNARILDLLRQTPDIETVLLVGRWAYYAEGGGIGADAHNHVEIWQDGARGQRPNGTVFSDGLSATIEALTAMGKRVVLLRQVPEMEDFKPSALAASLMLRGSEATTPRRDKTSKIEVARVMARQKVFDRAVAAWSSNPQVRLLDPWPHFCDAETCRAIVGTQARYFDNNHVTTAMARALAPVFALMFHASPR